MATSGLKNITVGSVEIQSGSGTPDHIASTGTTYTDITTGFQYRNIDGGTNWNQVLVDTYITGGTFTNNYLLLRNNTGGTITTLVSSFSSITSSGDISASGNIIASGNIVASGNAVYNGVISSGGTNLNNIFKPINDLDVFVTGTTFTNNILTLTNNTGGTINILINNLSGLTVNGNTSVTGNMIITGTTNISGQTSFGSNIISGGTNLNNIFRNINVLDVFVTGVTFTNNILTLTNNTGGTINRLINNLSGLTVNGNTSVSGNVIITGTTNISGQTSFGGNIISGGTNLNLLFEPKLAKNKSFVLSNPAAGDKIPIFTVDKSTTISRVIHQVDSGTTAFNLVQGVNFFNSTASVIGGTGTTVTSAATTVAVFSGNPVLTSGTTLSYYSTGSTFTSSIIYLSIFYTD